MFRNKKRALAKDAAAVRESFSRAFSGGGWPPEDEMWRISAAVLRDVDSAGAAQFSRYALVRLSEYLPLVNHPGVAPTWASIAMTTAALDLAQARTTGSGNDWSTGLAKGLRATAKDAATLESGLKGEPAEMMIPRWYSELGSQPLGEQIAQVWCLYMAWFSEGPGADDLAFVNALDAAASEYRRIIADSRSR